jgi:hypothetical protein
MLELVLVLVLCAVILLWRMPPQPRLPAADGLGYRVDARRWPLLEVVRSDGGHFRSFDGVRWFRFTSGRFARVGGSLEQVERDKFEELTWDEASELIDWLRGVFAQHGTTFFDVGAQRLILETDHGRTQKTA